MLRFLLIALFLALVAVLALRPLEGTQPLAPGNADEASAPGETAPRTGHTPGPAATAPGEEPGGRREITPGPRIASGRSTTVRGRCVDESGRPLPGLRVELRGWERNTQVTAEHRLDHGEVVWSNPPPVETDPLGRFSFRFAPAPPYQFGCDVEPTDRVPVRFRWLQLAAGDVKDVGDVELEPGVVVRGVVIDANGTGLRGVRGTIEAVRDENGRTKFETRDEHRREQIHRTFLHTGPRGAFEVDQRLPAGAYRVSLREHELIEPDLPIELAAPRADLRLIARPLADEPSASIEGSVVDALGQPVLGVRVFARSETGDALAGGAISREEGRFELLRPKRYRDAAAAHLGTERQGFVDWRSAEPVAWSTQDLRIQLTSGPPLTLRVVRGDDGAPVERYGIVLAPERDGISSSSDRQLLHLGDHVGGVLTIPRVTPRTYRLEVRPPTGLGVAASAPQSLAIEPGRPLDLTVRLPARATRHVEVMLADGRPAANARFEWLFNHGGLPVTPTTWAMDADNARRNHPQHVAELVADGTTDARGSFQFEAAIGRDYALRLPGPGHVPKIVQPVRVEDADPLRVVVGAGATLRGRVSPLGVLEQLRAEALDDVDAQPPAIRLSGRGTREHQAFPGGSFQDSRLEIDAGGRFLAEGVPPGTWAVMLTWRQSLPRRGGGVSGSSSATRMALDGVELGEGQTREVEIDLSPWRRQPVEFTVRRNGQPIEAMLRLHGTHGLHPDGEPERGSYTVYTDEDGTATQALRPGEWSVDATVRIDGHQAPARGADFTVVAGQPTRRIDLELRIAQRRVQVILPDGTPAEGIELQPILAPGSARQTASAPTDARGRTTLYGCPGPVPLRTVRRPLIDFAGRIQWQKEHPDSNYAAIFAPLDDVELVFGEHQPQVLRLPEEWTRLPD